VENSLFVTLLAKFILIAVIFVPMLVLGEVLEILLPQIHTNITICSTFFVFP
jgi:hypothetical protein